MKIKGSLHEIYFDMENGYVMKASGELQPHAKFIVYKSSMKKWMPPHENEEITKEIKEDIIRQATSLNGEGKVEIIFE